MTRSPGLMVASIAARRSRPASPGCCADGSAPSGRRRLKGTSIASGRLHQLETVAERIANVTAVEPLERHVVGNAIAGELDPLPKGLQVPHQEGGMCLAGRRERLLDAQVHLESLGPEP